MCIRDSTDGVLLGIVTRADLLRVFLQDDAEIHAQILDDIIVRQMALSPSDVEVLVNEGIDFAWSARQPTDGPTTAGERARRPGCGGSQEQPHMSRRRCAPQT